MKITAIKTFVATFGSRSRALIKVETDEGIHGWGEAYSVGPDLSVEPIVDYIHIMIGEEDPRRIEYIMMNQLNSQLVGDIDDIATNSDSITMILAADHTGSSAPRIIYDDTDSDGQATGIADQADASTHDGVVSFDSTNYKVADTVTVTVVDVLVPSENVDQFESSVEYCGI